MRTCEPTQSANARPCNCDQAIAAEARADVAERRLAAERAAHEASSDDTLAAETRCEALTQTLATITRILCDLVSAPSLSVAQFADPTLERIRLAMLGRER